MFRLYLAVLMMSALAALGFARPAAPSRTEFADNAAPLRVAQISDTHLGERRAPHAAENLRRVVELVNGRHPDVVLVTGDMGENPAAWQEARSILRAANAPVYYVPGNHDVHTADLLRYRAVFGPDYYTFRVKHVNFVVIDSQLLGNYDRFAASSPQPLPARTAAESEKMLAWMAAQAPKLARSGIVIGLQHIPAYRSADFHDPKPYWVLSDPYRSREIELLHAMNVRHVLAGHWHFGRVFDADGITWHIGPASSWLPWGGQLGFALHTIQPDGAMQTEFIDLDGNTSVAENQGESPESLCKAESVRSVRICLPADGAVAASPFHVLAAAHGEGLVKLVQIYVDGKKKYETAGDIMSTDLPLPHGKHEFIVQALDENGFFRSRIFIDVR